MKPIFDELLKKFAARLDFDNEQWERQCYSAKNDEERVKLMMKVLQRYKITPSMKTEKKNSAKSKGFIDKGNKLYKWPKDGIKLDTIIENYTKSVVYAPPGSSELPLAYANRSAALFRARLYNDCLQDIERAVKLDYPEKLRAKLFVRKAQCLIALNSSKSESEKVLKEARHWLEEMDLKDSERKIVEETLNNPKQMESIDKPRILLEDDRNMPEIPNDNPEMPGVSSAIKLKYSGKYGKHFVATRDIEPGEVLVVEQAYALVLNVERRYDHCGNCLKQTWSGIPCDHCIEVIYCSEVCRQAAWNDYHEIECQVIGPLIALDTLKAALVALRLTVRAVREAGCVHALKDKLAVIDSRTDLRTQGFTQNVLDQTKHASIHTLTRHSMKRSKYEFFHASVTSAVISYMLATSDKLFGEKLNLNWSSLIENKLVTFVGGLIMRYMEIFANNSRQIYAARHKETLARGAAIGAFMSLFNHNCYPNVTEYGMGRNNVIASTDFIKKGERIFRNYGPLFFWDSKAERRKILEEKFFFDCECDACREDWPLLGNLPNFKEQIVSEVMESKMSVTLKYIQKYDELACSGNVEITPVFMKGLINFVKLFNEQVRPPCNESANIFLLLRDTYSLLGNRWQLLD